MNEVIIHKDLNLTGKKLTVDDFDQYIKFIDKNPFFWKKKLTVTEKNVIFDNYYQKLSNKLCLCLGVFKDNELISESSSFYPESYPCWYILSLTGNFLEYKSVFRKLEYYSSLYIYNKFIEHGESINYYNFYTIRPTNHQKYSNYKFYNNKLKKESLLKRYSSLYEYCYLPGEKCKFINHKIFFKTFEHYDDYAYVYLQCLKEEHRPTIQSLNP